MDEKEFIIDTSFGGYTFVGAQYGRFTPQGETREKDYCNMFVLSPVTINLPQLRDNRSRARGISLPKLLEWRGNGLTLTPKSFALDKKSVSHPSHSRRSICAGRVPTRYTRVSKQMESAMGKDGSPL